MAVVHKAVELGGAGLNFTIVGGTTQPASPKENTIWINTDTPIGEWQFSATEPTTRADGTALQSGDVWIEINDNADIVINAIKKNGVNIGLNSVHLRNGTAWKETTSKIYKNSAWEEIQGRYYLFKAGSVNRLINGWNISTQGGTMTEPAVDSNGYLSATVTIIPYLNRIHKTGIDLANYTKLVFKVEEYIASNGNGNSILALGFYVGNDVHNQALPSAYCAFDGVGVFECDISALSTTLYLGIAARYRLGGDIKFSEIYLQ